MPPGWQKHSELLKMVVSCCTIVCRNCFGEQSGLSSFSLFQLLVLHHFHHILFDLIITSYITSLLYMVIEKLYSAITRKDEECRKAEGCSIVWLTHSMHFTKYPHCNKVSGIV